MQVCKGNAQPWMSDHVSQKHAHNENGKLLWNSQLACSTIIAAQRLLSMSESSGLSLVGIVK